MVMTCVEGESSRTCVTIGALVGTGCWVGGWVQMCVSGSVVVDSGQNPTKPLYSGLSGGWRSTAALEASDARFLCHTSVTRPSLVLSFNNCEATAFFLAHEQGGSFVLFIALPMCLCSYNKGEVNSSYERGAT